MRIPSGSLRIIDRLGLILAVPFAGSMMALLFLGIFFSRSDSVVLGVLTGLTVASGAVFFTGLWLARRWVAEPIARLAEIARTYEKGDFSPGALLLRKDELGGLATALDTMAGRTQQLVASLELRREYAERMLEAMPVSIIVVDQEGRIATVNRVFSEKCGVDPSALVGRMASESVGIDSLDRILGDVLKDGQPRIGLELLARFVGHAHSSPVRVSIASAGPLTSSSRRLFIAIEDRTEQERTSSHARFLERRFQEVIHSASDGIVITSAMKTVQYMNPAAQKMFGGPTDSFRGRPFASLVPDVEASGSSDLPVDLTAVRKDGSTFAIEVVRSAFEVDGMTNLTYLIRDISERQAAEAALRQSESSFRTLIESSPDIIAIHRGGFIQYLNPKGVRFLGYESASEVIGKPILEVVAPSDRQPILERIRAMLSTGQPTPAREEGFIRKDGSIVTAEVIALPVTFEGQSSFAVLARDTSERRELVAQLMRVDRLASMGTLAAGVGHEINNPLSYVMSNIEYAISLERRRSAEPDGTSMELGRALEEAKEGTERIQKIVHELRHFSRADTQELTTIQVEQTLDFAASLAMSQIKHRATLVKEYGKTPPIATNDSRLGQVVLNLLVNAAQAIPVGRASEHRITLRTRSAATAVEIEVADTGSGMPPDVAARVWEPFFTTKPIGQGTGLGLSIVRSIVCELQGEISFTTEQGRGTTFRLCLPLRTGPAPAAKDRSEPSPPPSKRRAQVLVVDDEVRFARALVRSLSDHHEATYAASGFAALESIRSNPSIDVVICDLMMPEMTGMELSAALQRLDPTWSKRMIFLTGGAYTDEAKSFSSAAFRCFDKPVDFPGLLSTIAEMVESVQAPLVLSTSPADGT